MARVSVIVPTYNRPRDLEVCLASVLRQTVLPDEVLVVDDGCLEAVPLAADYRRAGVDLRYFRKQTPGLTASRNLGIDNARGSIVFFLDDDVELFDDFVERICEEFHADRAGRVGGVGGRIVNLPAVRGGRRLLHYLERLFLLSGPVEGRVLPSGFCVDYGDTGRVPPGPVAVDFLPGGATAWRRQVFDTFRFSLAYTGYGQGEDKDFSFRVRQQYRLIFTPRARLYHYQSPQMRFSPFEKGYEFVRGRHRFFTEHLRPAGRSRFLFAYALCGYFLKRLLVFAAGDKRREFQRLRGMARAVLDIVREAAT